MIRVKLRVYREPEHAEVYLSVKRKDNGYDRITAVVDTGTQLSLLPASMMADVDYRDPHNILIQRAGMDSQVFQGIQATITLYIEDETGAATSEREAIVWFADTVEISAGFNGILDRAILHLDMPNLTGYPELP